MAQAVAPPALGSRQPGARAVPARATAASRTPRRNVSPLSVPPRWGTRRTRSRGQARAAGRPRRIRQTPVHVHGASSAPIMIFAAPTLAPHQSGVPCGFESGTGTEPVQRSGVAANEGSTAREAAFRIEPRAPRRPLFAHPRRADVHAEPAVESRRASGRAVPARPPNSRARARRSSADHARASPARRPCGACARHAHCCRRADYEPNALSGPGASGAGGPGGAARLPCTGIAARARYSCSSPPPAGASHRRGAQASLPRKAAPAVKRRFASSFARCFLPLSAARAYAPGAQPWPAAGRPRGHALRSGLPCAGKELRRRCSRCAPSRRLGGVRWLRAAAASTLALERSRRSGAWYSLAPGRPWSAVRLAVGRGAGAV
jgi:hypothetical protein